MGFVFYSCIRRVKDRIEDEEKMKLLVLNESKNSIKNSLTRKNVDTK